MTNKELLAARKNLAQRKQQLLSHRKDAAEVQAEIKQVEELERDLWTVSRVETATYLLEAQLERVFQPVNKDTDDSDIFGESEESLSPSWKIWKD